MKKTYVILINFVFIMIETILVILINACLFDFLYYYDPESTFCEWFHNRTFSLILLPFAFTIYGGIMCFAIKKNKIGGVGLAINSIFNFATCLPLCMVVMSNFVSVFFSSQSNEIASLERFRGIICIISYLVLLVFNILSTVHIINNRSQNTRESSMG